MGLLGETPTLLLYVRLVKTLPPLPYQRFKVVLYFERVVVEDAAFFLCTHRVLFFTVRQKVFDFCTFVLLYFFAPISAVFYRASHIWEGNCLRSPLQGVRLCKNPSKGISTIQVEYISKLFLDSKTFRIFAAETNKHNHHEKNTLYSLFTIL